MLQRAHRLAGVARGLATRAAPPVQVHNPSGLKRVVVTKDLPGSRWLEILTSSGCRVEVRVETPPHAPPCSAALQVCTSPETILTQNTIKELIGEKCDGVIGQLTEKWDSELFGALKRAGGKAYSNYAVGYDNVVVADATAAGIAVGNTPGESPRNAGATFAALLSPPAHAASRRLVRRTNCT